MSVMEGTLAVEDLPLSLQPWGEEVDPHQMVQPLSKPPAMAA